MAKMLFVNLPCNNLTAAIEFASLTATTVSKKRSFYSSVGKAR